MGRIICITGHFPIYDRNGFDTGDTEFVVSHGVDEETGKTIVLTNVHPSLIGAKWDKDLGEYVIKED